MLAWNVDRTQVSDCNASWLFSNTFEAALTATQAVASLGTERTIWRAVWRCKAVLAFVTPAPFFAPSPACVLLFPRLQWPESVRVPGFL